MRCVFVCLLYYDRYLSVCLLHNDIYLSVYICCFMIDIIFLNSPDFHPKVMVLCDVWKNLSTCLEQRFGLADHKHVVSFLLSDFQSSSSVVVRATHNRHEFL